MVTTEIIKHSGAIVTTALVKEKGYPDISTQWCESQTYYGYTKLESKNLFLKYLIGRGYEIVK